MHYVYALRSLIDNNLYIGISADPSRRLKDHNFGMTSSNRSRRPFELIYKGKCSDRVAARKREKYLKSGSGREFLKSLFPGSSVGRAVRC